jgi:hypothetical protein
MSQKTLQRKLIEDAVFYRYCVERKLIMDPDPVKTIALSYGVSISSVQKWEQDPEFEHVKRHDPKEAPDPYSIRSLLEIHGEMYRKNFSLKKILN